MAICQFSFVICVFFSSFVDDPPMTWFEANVHCNGEGGKLVEIDSEEENRALAEEINERGYTEAKKNFWMGLTDRKTEGDWRLESNNKPPSYLNWDNDDGQPTNYGGIEDCARLRMGKESWKDKWSDLSCSTRKSIYMGPITLHALCEFEKKSHPEKCW